ncbi:hypothetical protein PGT21_015735 [Puccinia graminis f. sp. tritici]|uniref:Uncharacterized protein n=1 Tax=Puccinia graminis f. sp. tritici TaxID=56615 RepID=A0A5B0PF52_PUCGR|nr:hypothetical protein PGT21_015735 [Puccinia graminis f. sp. tritici]
MLCLNKAKRVPSITAERSYPRPRPNPRGVLPEISGRVMFRFKSTGNVPTTRKA